MSLSKNKKKNFFELINLSFISKFLYGLEMLLERDKYKVSWQVMSAYRIFFSEFQSHLWKHLVGTSGAIEVSQRECYSM